MEKPRNYTRRNFLGAAAVSPFLLGSIGGEIKEGLLDVLTGGKTPLAETHLHLSGAHTAERVKSATEKHNIERFKGKTLEEIRTIIQAPTGADWDTWYKHLVAVRGAYVSPEAIGDLTEGVIRDVAKDGVDLLELRVSLLSAVKILLKNIGAKADPQTYWRYAQQVFDQIILAIERMNADPDVHTQTDLIMCISCQEKYRHLVTDYVRLCIAHKDKIIALDLTNEKDNPPSKYKDHIEKARGDIKGFTAHCMEIMGPERGRDLLSLNPDRVGHGINIVQDPALVEMYAELGIPFEVCIHSNVMTGAVKSLEDHPLRKMYDAGLNVMLAADGMNDGSTLSHNYQLAKQMSFSPKEIENMRSNSWRYAFRNLLHR